MTKDNNNKIEYIRLSSVLEAMVGASILDLSDPKTKKAFIEKKKEGIISEHKKGNLSFYASSGWCIDDMLSILSQKHELHISENQKNLELGNIIIFPDVLLDADQIIGQARKHNELENSFNDTLKS